MRKSIAIFFVCALFGFFVTGCKVGDPSVGQSIGEVAPNDPNLPQPFDKAAYKSAPERLVDVFLPENETPTGMAVIFVHGGGWLGGNKETARESPIFRFLLKQGHVGMSINYTLARINGVNSLPIDCRQTDSPFPENLYDVKWAIAWANQAANKEKYGYSRVIIVGESAGGHLAGLAAVTSEDYPAGMSLSESVRPDAAVTLVAPVDMQTWGA